ncbi:hypothetical protein [Dietzia sp.]|uniref:hypothetical protein n=1 Tax=Dietzia sp. TaxID=1871616 RepID=UPI002FD8AC31
MAWTKKNSGAGAATGGVPDTRDGRDVPGALDAASPEGYRKLPLEQASRREKIAERWLRRALDKAVETQKAPAEAYVRHLRSARPEESPAQVVERLDKYFVRAVGGAGTAAGATAMVPGIGTMVAFGAIGADAVAFLEAVTFHSIAKATVYGVDTRTRDQREVLVSIILLGSAGNAIVERASKGRKGASIAKKATELPDLGRVNNFVFRRLVRTFVYKRLKGSMAKVLPAGVGAALGGWSNVKAGKAVVSRSSEAFGPAPTTWPSTPELTAAEDD